MALRIPRQIGNPNQALEIADVAVQIASGKDLAAVEMDEPSAPTRGRSGQRRRRADCMQQLVRVRHTD